MEQALKLAPTGFSDLSSTNLQLCDLGKELNSLSLSFSLIIVTSRQFF